MSKSLQRKLNSLSTLSIMLKTTGKKMSVEKVRKFRQVSLDFNQQDLWSNVPLFKGAHLMVCVLTQTT